MIWFDLTVSPVNISSRPSLVENKWRGRQDAHRMLYCLKRKKIWILCITSRFLFIIGKEKEEENKWWLSIDNQGTDRPPNILIYKRFFSFSLVDNIQICVNEKYERLCSMKRKKNNRCSFALGLNFGGIFRQSNFFSPCLWV